MDLHNLSPEQLRQIAQSIRKQGGQLSLESALVGVRSLPMVAIRRRGTKQPLFLADPVGGSVRGYYDLANWLDAEQPVYGFQRYRLGDTEVYSYSSVEHLAATYIEALRTIQPHGPYLLGGYSMGGIVAFEMALQLQADGEETLLVVMIDSPAHPAAKDSQAKLSTLDHLQMLGTALSVGEGREFTFEWTQIEKLNPEDQVRAFASEVWRQKLTTVYVKEPSWQALLATVRNSYDLMSGYTPKPYSGRIAIVRAAIPAAELHGIARQCSAEPDFGWQRFSPCPLIVEYIQSGHIELLAEPHVRQVASVIQHWLDELAK